MTLERSANEVTAAMLSVVRTSVPFDVCCAHALPEKGLVGRCQLWAGHDGDHAVMFVRAGERVVRAWNYTGPDLEVADSLDVTGRAWCRGFPCPAWSED